MKKLLNIFIGINFAWVGINAIYFGLIPEHIRVMLPEYNWLTALVSGGATGFFGSAAIYVKSLLSKERKDTSEIVEKQNNIIFSLLDAITSLEEKVLKADKKIDTNNLEVNKINIHYGELIKQIKRLIKLQEVDLASKLTNPLLDEDKAEEIRGVLSEKEN